MAKILIKKYLHEERENNWDIVDQFGHKDFAYCCYEVELLVELDAETGKSKVVGCDGFLLGDNEYKDKEITKVTG